MNDLAQTLFNGVPIFRNERQSMIYLTLLQNEEMGAEHLHQHTLIHRETIQRELKDMEERGVVTITQHGRNRKATAVPISSLQEKLEQYQINFDQLLKPLLVSASSNKKKTTSAILHDNHAYSLLQTRLMKLQPENTTVHVMSVQPEKWARAMLDHRKLEPFEKLRVKKKVKFQLLCFSELRGQIERNTLKYFVDQPKALKREYRYVDSELSSPIQIQVWHNTIVMSIFSAVPSIHITIENTQITTAMDAYFNLLWALGK